MSNKNEYKSNFLNNEFNKYCKDYTYTPFIIDTVDRIVVYGDIHGDYKYAVKLLIMSGVAKIVGKELDKENKSTNSESDEISSSFIYKMKWIGGKTHVVQVGDQVDRCRTYGDMACNMPETTLNDENSDVKIMELFTDLHEQAVKVGGAVISLLGNHELMNAQGNMSYVSFKGLEGFLKYNDPENPQIQFDNGEKARAYAFSPGRQYGKFMGCSRYPAIIIGSNLFAHAGIVNSLLDSLKNLDTIKEDEYGKIPFELTYDKTRYNDKKYKQILYFKDREQFENINILIKRWLLGIVKYNTVHDFIDPDEKSIFWTRILGMLKSGLDFNSSQCINNIDKVLKIFNVDNIVIGHTPQSMLNGLNINATCGDKVWRVDVASSSAFDRFDETYVQNGTKLESRRFQYLEILNDKEYKVCYESDTEKNKVVCETIKNKK